MADYEKYKEIGDLSPEKTIIIISEIMGESELVPAQKLYAIGLVLDQNKETYIKSLKYQVEVCERQVQKLLMIREVGSQWERYQQLMCENGNLRAKLKNEVSKVRIDSKYSDLYQVLEENNLSLEAAIEMNKKIKRYRKLKEDYQMLLKITQGKFVDHYEITDDDLNGLEIEVELESGTYLKNLVALRKDLSQAGKRHSNKDRKIKYLAEENNKLKSELEELAAKIPVNTPKKKVVVVRKNPNS